MKGKENEEKYVCVTDNESVCSAELLIECKHCEY